MFLKSSILSLVLISNLVIANNHLYLDLKYPKVAKVISKLETANYKSNLYRNHNNLFGFKVNSRKLYIGKTKQGYAIYKSKLDSVKDYAMYEKYLIKKYKIKNRKQYIFVISKVYAKDKHYLKKLNKMLYG